MTNDVHTLPSPPPQRLQSPRQKKPRGFAHTDLLQHTTRFGTYLVQAIDAARIGIRPFCELVSQRTPYKWYDSRFRALVSQPRYHRAHRKTRGVSDQDLWVFAEILGIHPVNMFTAYYGSEHEIQESFIYLWQMLRQFPKDERTDVVNLVEQKAHRLGVTLPQPQVREAKRRRGKK